MKTNFQSSSRCFWHLIHLLLPVFLIFDLHAQPSTESATVDDSARPLVKSVEDLQWIETYITYKNSVFRESDIISRFLESIRYRDEQSPVKNGDLEEAYLLFQEFDSLRMIVEKEQRNQELLNYEVSLKRMYPTEDSIDLYTRKRLEETRSALKGALQYLVESEKLLARQRAHFPALEAYLNDLKNSRGERIPIYLFSHPTLEFGEVSFNALTIMAKIGKHFTSDTPILRKIYPTFKKHNRGFVIHAAYNQPGKTLSHEYGHILYLYYHWEEYKQYVQKLGANYQFGGHGPCDPNGKAANAAEKGILPSFLNNLR